MNIIRLCLFAGIASTIYATPTYVPTGLAPGQTYRLIFVTDSTTDTLSTDVADYNAFVTAEGLTGALLLAIALLRR